MNYTETLKKYALAVPEVLLPKNKKDLSRWAVIACDQFTQDRDYWRRVAEYAGNEPTTLHMILPEVYLEDEGRKERLCRIRSTMKSYLGEKRVFAPPVQGFVYIERKTAYNRTRKGLVASIDLDAYDWKPDSTSLIRATEATIVDRIPPRMEIRRGAPLEAPHIMLLVNDPKKTLIEATGKRVNAKTPLYSTDLMLNSGSIAGWQVSSDTDLEYISEKIKELAKEGTQNDGSCFLFAVGDGNHSLATAKAVWDEFKKENSSTATREQNIENHRARYALVEIVNLFDDGLTFEPIHRVLFGADAEALKAYLANRLGGALHSAKNEHELENLVAEKNTTRFGFVRNGTLSYLDTPDKALAVSRLQPVLDDFIALNPLVKIDYIHGSEEVFRLGKENNAVAILLPPVEKDSFFATIATGGPLPRKSFSMGEASEKRFYVECRELF